MDTFIKYSGYALMVASVLVALAFIYYLVMYLWWTWLKDGKNVIELQKELIELRKKRRSEYKNP